MLFWMLKWFELDLVQFRDGLLIMIVYGFNDVPNTLLCFAPLYCTLLLSISLVLLQHFSDHLLGLCNELGFLVQSNAVAS